MSNFFHNVYDPTEADIQRMFPAYKQESREYWVKYYNTHRANAGPYTPQSDARFALNKLDPVTTSRRLTNQQRVDLESLINGQTIHGHVGWDAYCNILTPAQIEHVGW